MQDIKEHKTNTTIKSNADDIKIGASNKIKSSVYSSNKENHKNELIDRNIAKFNNDDNKSNSDNKDIGNKVISNEKNLIESSAAGTYSLSKETTAIPIKKFKKNNVDPARKSFKQASRDTKLQNKQAKNNIKSAKQQYKNFKKNTNDKTQIKTEKKKLKNNVLNEQLKIKGNKKRLKGFKNILKKNVFSLKKLKFLATAVGIVTACVIMVSIVGLMVSPLGVLFASDSDNSYSVESAIRIINEEFSEQLEEIKNSYEYDAVSISNQGCLYTLANWQNVFAIWSVYTYDSGFVFEIDNSQLDAIRQIAFKMININSRIVDEVVVTDSSEANVATIKKLQITVDYLSIEEMADKYSFTEYQKNELNELMRSDDYMDLFRSATNSAVGGDIIGSENFIYPVKVVNITATYPSYSDGSYHSGVDFSVPKGSEIMAASDGVVSTVRKLNYSYGYYIIIDHGNGLSTLYAHNSEILVNEGTVVKQGDIIAYSGSTGNSTGPHCHFEVRINGNCVDPMPYLK